MARAHPVAYAYLPDEETLELTHLEPVSLQVPEDFTDYFDQVLENWRAHTGAKRVYYLVNWNNFSVNLLEQNAYTSNVRRIYEHAAITIVRFGADPVQQTAGRLASLRLHKPSHVYTSREEALAVIRGLRNGSVAVAT